MEIWSNFITGIRCDIFLDGGVLKIRFPKISNFYYKKIAVENPQVRFNGLS